MSAPGDTIVPIQIREGVWVRIQGIPLDMTAAEARRLANIVKSFATGSDDADTPQRKGGLAAAAGMTPRERIDRARKAAQARWQEPTQ